MEGTTTSLGQITPVFMEKLIGDLVAPNIEQVHGGADPDARIQVYVRGVGGRLLPYTSRKDVAYDFTVLASTDIPNAYALGNGKTYITRALLKMLDNEAQLAAILGHELGHVDRRHIAKQLDVTLGSLAVASIAAKLLDRFAPGFSRKLTVRLQGLGAEAPAPPPADEEIMSARDVMVTLLVSGYSRRHELEADRSGLSYAARAGYNPYAIVDVMKKFQALEGEPETGIAKYMRSHPLAADRISELEARIREDWPTPIGDLGYDAYQAVVNPERGEGYNYLPIVAGGAAAVGIALLLYLTVIASRK